MKPGRPLSLDYKRDRRFREGLRWKTDKPPRRRVTDLAKIGLLLLIMSICLPLIVVMAQQLFHVQTKLEQQIKVSQKFSAMLATVMNGKPLYDKTSGRAFFFEKPYIMNVGK